MIDTNVAKVKGLSDAPRAPYVTPCPPSAQPLIALGTPWTVWQAQAARQGHAPLADLFSRLAGGENGRP